MYNRMATWKKTFDFSAAQPNLDDCGDKVEYEEEGGGEVKDLDGEDDEDEDGVPREEQAQ